MMEQPMNVNQDVQRQSAPLPDGIERVQYQYYAYTPADLGARRREFETIEQAVKYKEKIEACSHALELLPRAADQRAFESYQGYVQHTPAAVKQLADEVRQLIDRYYDGRDVQGKDRKADLLQRYDEFPRDIQLCRDVVNSDYDVGRVHRRLCSIDEFDREWADPGAAWKCVEWWKMRKEIELKCE